MVRMTGREAGWMNTDEAEILTPGRLGTHWLTQVSAYPAASGPLGAQLVPGVDRGLCGELGMVPIFLTRP